MNKTDSAAWVQVRAIVVEQKVEAAEEAMFETGAVSVTLLDAEDHPLHEPLPGQTPMWPIMVIQGLYPADTRRSAICERLLSDGLIDSATALEFETMADQDWVRAWMDQFQPMRFGRSTWICPWHVEPDPDWPLVIRLDPGLAFGSGTHPTTALCLEWLDGQELTDKTVIDYGCGSGLLGIAAALKGARTCLGVDYDPQALTATRDNAMRNQVGDRFQALLPDEFMALLPEQRQADVVLANILAGPLISLSDSLGACLRPGGKLVLSGILPDQADDVALAYRALDPTPGREIRDGWVRLDFQAPGAGSP